MQVTVAKTAGFCFGVRRALGLTPKNGALSPPRPPGGPLPNTQGGGGPGGEGG